MTTETRRGVGISRIAYALVPVEDADAAIAFYTDELGFELAADNPYEDGQRWTEVALPGCATTIALVPSHGDYPAGSHTGIALATADARALHARLTNSGVDVDAELMGGGETPAFFWLRDRDGNTLMVVENA
jgi:catechol 2,3-dioxygenase-like lactoylglutathione lyase family enzyme